jgi:predicted MPP superfamily phosphohydrolase
MTEERAAEAPPESGQESRVRSWLDPKNRIRLRTFAGPSEHASQLSHPIRVAHLTDQHVGRVTPMSVQYAAVDLTNAQEPDLVCITGDFIAHSHQHLDALQDVIAKIHAPVMAVLGNHDHWSGSDEVRRVLRKAGAEVLDNVNTTLTLHRERIQVVGLDDAYTGHADREKATRGLNPKLCTVGLSHIAEEADFLWFKDVPLVLSGHTHGGQVTWARLHELMVGRVSGHKYIHGLYGCRNGEQEAGAVYVGAGIGASVMPLRLGDRGKREVAIFELGVSPGSLDDEDHAEQVPLPGRKPTPELTRKRRMAAIKKAARRRAKHHRRNGGTPAEDPEG